MVHQILQSELDYRLMDPHLKSLVETLPPFCKYKCLPQAYVHVSAFTKVSVEHSSALFQIVKLLFKLCDHIHVRLK